MVVLILKLVQTPAFPAFIIVFVEILSDFSLPMSLSLFVSQAVSLK